MFDVAGISFFPAESKLKPAHSRFSAGDRAEAPRHACNPFQHHRQVILKLELQAELPRLLVRGGG